MVFFPESGQIDPKQGDCVMKKIVILVVVLALALFALFIATASAAGGGSSAGQSSLNSSIDLGDVRYSMSTYDEGGGRYGLNLSLDTSCGVINNASITMSRDKSNPLQGQVYANISGLLDVIPELVDWRSQSTSIQRRNGLNFSSNAGIGSQQQQIWDGKGLVLGDIFSEANLGMSLSNVDAISYASAQYYEYDARDWTWTDQDGSTWTQHDPARFYVWASWNILFENQTAANTAFAVQPMMVSMSAVPEPSTFALLASGVAGLGFVVWRKKR